MDRLERHLNCSCGSMKVELPSRRDVFERLKPFPVNTDVGKEKLYLYPRLLWQGEEMSAPSAGKYRVGCCCLLTAIYCPFAHQLVNSSLTVTRKGMQIIDECGLIPRIVYFKSIGGEGC